MKRGWLFSLHVSRFTFHVPSPAPLRFERRFPDPESGVLPVTPQGIPFVPTKTPKPRGFGVSRSLNSNPVVTRRAHSPGFVVPAMTTPKCDGQRSLLAQFYIGRFRL